MFALAVSLLNIYLSEKRTPSYKIGMKNKRCYSTFTTTFRKNIKQTINAGSSKQEGYKICTGFIEGNRTISFYQ